MLTSTSNLWRTLTLAALLATPMVMPQTAQATVFKCAQPDGKIAFQEFPCSGAPAQTKPASKGSTPRPATPAPLSGTPGTCAYAGELVFKRLQHTQPHAATLACQREVQASVGSGAGLEQCVQDCMDTWIRRAQGSTRKSTP